MYFDNAAAVRFDETHLTVRVHAKHRDDDSVAICNCFGYTARTIGAAQVSEGPGSVSRAIAAEIRAGHCACEVKNPKGRCCLSDVVRVERAIQSAASEEP